MALSGHLTSVGLSTHAHWQESGRSQNPTRPADYQLARTRRARGNVSLAPSAVAFAYLWPDEMLARLFVSSFASSFRAYSVIMFSFVTFFTTITKIFKSSKASPSLGPLGLVVLWLALCASVASGASATADNSSYVPVATLSRDIGVSVGKYTGWIGVNCGIFQRGAQAVFTISYNISSVANLLSASLFISPCTAVTPSGSLTPRRRFPRVRPLVCAAVLRAPGRG